MYSVPFPVAVIRTRMRQEFERHRFVNKLPVVDVLLMQNNAEYQVSQLLAWCSYDRWEPGLRSEEYDVDIALEALLTDYRTGNDELLEANYARHVIFQDRELPSWKIADELHVGFPRGKFLYYNTIVQETPRLTAHQGRN